MLFGNLNDREFCNVSVCRAPDGGDGGGGSGGDPNAAPTDDKKFSQADVDSAIDKRLARQKKEHEKNVQAIQEQLAALAAKNQELEQKLTPPNPEPPKDMAGQIELISAKHEREMAGVRSQLEEFKRTAETEKQRRLETERDKLLHEALAQAQCRDITCGYRYFLHQIQYDDVDKQWVMKTKKDNIVSIADGVAEELPDYLKPSVMMTGGSGSNGGSPLKKTEKMRILEDKKKELADQMTIARKNPQDGGQVVKVQQIKRQVKDLELELAKTK